MFLDSSSVFDTVPDDSGSFDLTGEFLGIDYCASTGAACSSWQREAAGVGSLKHSGDFTVKTRDNILHHL
jgi:hypothetical protein